MSNFFYSNVKSFALRSGRVTSAQKRALQDYSEFFCVPFSKKELPPEKIFGNSNPIVFDIGFGMGDEIVDFSTKNPTKNLLGIEMYKPAIGNLLKIIYEKNKSLIKSKLSKHLSSRNIQYGIEQLLTNLHMWSEEIVDIDTSEARDVPLTKEMDVLTLHESLKMNKIKEEQMSQELLAEFKRIKLLGSSII